MVAAGQESFWCGGFKYLHFQLLSSPRGAMLRGFLMSGAMPLSGVISVASGGARNRSGPSKDPNSIRSSGMTYVNLPAGGFDGDAPEFPLPMASERELETWARLWKTPQAAAWSVEEWRWSIVAMYTRLFVRSEQPDAAPTLISQLHRLADQIGMTPAGLKENGWLIAHDEVSGRRKPAAKSSARDRLRAVANDS